MGQEQHYCNVCFLYEGLNVSGMKKKGECHNEWQKHKKSKKIISWAKSRVAQEPPHTNQTIMCHRTVNETWSPVLNIEGEHWRTLSAETSLFYSAAVCMASVWLSTEQFWGKHWINYCTFLLWTILLSQILKIVNIRNLFLCTMCITIELWSSIEKLSEGIILFCVIFLLVFLVFWLQLYCKASEQIHLPPVGACCVLTCLFGGRMKAPCLNWVEHKNTLMWLKEERKHRQTENLALDE